MSPSSLSKDQLAQLLAREQFPRAGRYDPQWVLANQMGPHALWLTEWLCDAMNLRTGMRVLDMGCGRALSSIFLAREYGAQVWATDLWISATDNRRRIDEAGLSASVFPVHAEAHELPFAEEFFDAIVCVDSYIYYGTDDIYLDYFHKFVKPGGQIGMVVPGFMQDFDGPLPRHLVPFWAQECWTWHTVEWWRRHWARTELVNVELADVMPDGAKLWLEWKRARQAAGENSESLKSDIRVLEEDAGRYMGFVRMVARRC